MISKLLMLLTPILIALACAGMGVLLIRRGLRGRRAGDHPVCRVCGFDLFGLPSDQAACPECGGDLRATGAIQTGHRQRRMPLIYGGATLLLLIALLAGVIGTRVFREVQWQQLKPVAWLAREARSGDAAAWVELSRRARNRWIAADRAQVLTADALALQKDLAKPWLPAAGDFIEEARRTNLVSDTDWKTYARQAPQFSVQWRAKVRKGHGLPGEVRFGPSRAGTGMSLSVRVEKPIDTNDPLFIRPRQNVGSGYSQQTLSSTGSGGSSGVHLRLDPSKIESAPLGKRIATIQFTAEVRDDWDANEPITEWTQDLSGEWELVDRDFETVELISDTPELRSQIEQAVTVKSLEVQPASGREAGRQISLSLKIAAVPVPLSHDVFLRAGEREWKLASISASGAVHYGTGGYIVAKDNFDAHRVDIVFRPSPAPAYNSVDITRRWSGELTIRDVEVKWPATQTTKPE